MNDGSNSAWSAADDFDPSDPSFSTLLDFDHLDLDFDIGYADTGIAEHGANHQLTELAESLDVQHLQNSFSPGMLPDHHDGGVGAQQHQNTMCASAMSHPGDGFFEFDMPQFNQSQMYRPHSNIPPTPNSTEMHGDPGRYLHQMDTQDAMYGHSFHPRKEDASFTPLVSPAVTPHEARFRITDFTVAPGTYFSPLNSPALIAQNQQSHYQPHGQLNHYANSGSSAGTSPLDKDVDMMGDVAMGQPEKDRRLRSTKRSATRTTNAAPRVRQSPIVKPTRRKTTVSASMTPKDVSELVEETQRPRLAQLMPSGLEVPRSSDSSEFDSVSPEALSEMGPPPRPGSVTHSPAMFAQNGQTHWASCPATPASLMRIQQSPNLSDFPGGQPALDDLMLPEPSLEKSLLSRLDTAVLHNDGEDTPRMSARKTPKLGALSTPSAGAAMSGKPSPFFGSGASPSSPAFAPGSGRTLEPKSGRNMKKKNSITSTMVSPALRPKISPSIKPLLTEGGVSDDTHTMLLASKSNYQNILDGTTVPGVVYPTSLSTDLTSKRTSHKLAEQGRRNRINTALQEMQALIPSPKISPQDAVAAAAAAAANAELSSAAQSHNSKAAKVESAIDYIKLLQKQCSDKDRLLMQKDREFDELRQELAKFKRSAASDPTDAQMTSESDNAT